MNFKVFIDAGHGGYDTGASYNGRKEKDDNLNLALGVTDSLRRRGIETEVTRTTDIYQSPNEKAMLANESDADIIISFHRSSSPVPNTYEGVESYIYETGGISEHLANQINSNLEKLGFKNLGVDVRKNLAILKKTDMPAILVDVGFINTDTDNQRFDEKFNQVVEAIADAIESTIQSEGEHLPSVYYTVQVGLFRNYQNAVNLQAELIEHGFEAEIIPMGGLYAVVVGKFKQLKDAEPMKDKLENLGYETFILER